MQRSYVLVWVVVGCGFNSSGQSTGGGTSVGESGSTSTGTTVTTSATSSATETTNTATVTTDADTTMSPSESDSSGTPTTTTMTTTTDPSAGTSSSEAESTGVAAGCDTNNGGCDDDATCDDSRGGVKCMCNEGFVGDGITCATTPTMAILRAELPCTGGDCFGGATCFTASGAEESVMLVGEAGVTYDVTIALRGVLEQKEYVGGDCDGSWCIGGDDDDSPWNAVTLAVSDPLAEYHPNAGQAGLYEVFAIDYEQIIPIAAGATITLTFDGYGTCSIENWQDIVIGGVPPDPQAFDGQFLQVDLVTATLAG